MASRGRSTSPRNLSHRRQASDDDNFLNTRHLEAFGRTVHATATQLIAPGPSSSSSNHDSPSSDPYRSALTSLHRTVRRPMIQRSVFSFANANPRELLRSKFVTTEIEHRALTYLPDELIRTAPRGSSDFSLFEGFRASLPEVEEGAGDVGGRRGKKHGRRRGSRGQQRLIEGGSGVEEEKGGLAGQMARMKRERERLEHRVEMMGIRKSMCASEIREVDEKIANLNTMRGVILERLGGLEGEEHDLEVEVGDLAERLEELQEQLDDEAALAKQSPALGAVREEAEEVEEEQPLEEEGSSDFMSESIYQKLPKTPLQQQTPPKTKRKTPKRRASSYTIHQHMAPGSSLLSLAPAHGDSISALDFDAPFGTLVTAGLDDAVKVWDLKSGRCWGRLEGHLASVRCLQVEGEVVATGSGDAGVRVWDLGLGRYDAVPEIGSSITSKPPTQEDGGEVEGETNEAGDVFTPMPSTSASDPFDTASSTHQQQTPPTPPSEPLGPNALDDCNILTLSAHVAEVTALHFRNTTLVSGSADKTLRQWDLETGRCVQTLDVLWAAAQTQTQSQPQATTTNAGGGSDGGWWRPTTSRLMAGGAGAADGGADFVGALQVFDAALACGTADGVVRLWDLRSGMVHRSLVGHTGPVTALQFDDVYLVTGSRDRSVRIWDLRTGSIHDAFAYDSPISSMQFDARRIVAATGEDVVKVYDRTDGRHWDCGAGAAVVEGSTGAKAGVVERVRIKDGYLVEGRRDGVVGVWAC